MMRKFVIAAIAAIGLGACGPMDELEAAEMSGVFGSALYAPATVTSTQDPEPIKGYQGGWGYVAVSETTTSRALMMPGSTVSSTQDPEPIKGRPGSREVIAEAEGSATSTEQADTGGSTVSSTQDPEPIKPYLWLFYVATGGGAE